MSQNEITLILNALIFIVLGIISFFFKRYISAQDKRIERLELLPQKVTEINAEMKTYNNSTDEKRLNSHSIEIKEITARVIKNEERLANNIENGKKVEDMFGKLLDAKLKPIHDDLNELKGRKP